MKIIRSFAELHDLHLRLYKFDIYRKSELYKTAVPQWDVDQNIRNTNTLNRHSNKCGSLFGNLVMIVMFAAYILNYFNSGRTLAVVGWRELTELVIYTASGAIAGKIAGLFYARWQLIRFIQHLL